MLKDREHLASLWPKQRIIALIGKLSQECEISRQLRRRYSRILACGTLRARIGQVLAGTRGHKSGKIVLFQGFGLT